jgi:hypothetical protein
MTAIPSVTIRRAGRHGVVAIRRDATAVACAVIISYVLLNGLRRGF